MCQVLQCKQLYTRIHHQVDNSININCSRSNEEESHLITKDIFSEKAPTKLPPSQLYDHAIKLKNLFIPTQAKAYPLNPIKYQACKQSIKEHLKTTRISLSKSPQAVPLFFVKKKEAESYALDKTTGISTATQSKMPTLSHLSPTLLINSKNCDLYKI